MQIPLINFGLMLIKVNGKCCTQAEVVYSALVRLYTASPAQTPVHKASPRFTLLSGVLFLLKNFVQQPQVLLLPVCDTN